MNALQPPASLLAKVGSLLVHLEEASDLGGHPFDVEAARALVRDPEVRAWLDAMADLALVPVKRLPTPGKRAPSRPPT